MLPSAVPVVAEIWQTAGGPPHFKEQMAVATCVKSGIAPGAGFPPNDPETRPNAYVIARCNQQRRCSESAAHALCSCTAVLVRATRMRRSGRLLPKMRRQAGDLRARDAAWYSEMKQSGIRLSWHNDPPFVVFSPFPLTGVAPAKWPPAGS